MTAKHRKPKLRPTTRHRAGRVIQDARGNNVWQWNGQTGVFELDSTTIMLKRLDNEDLALAETAGIELTGRLRVLSNEEQASEKPRRLPGSNQDIFDLDGEALFPREDTLPQPSGAKVTFDESGFQLALEGAGEFDPLAEDDGGFDPYNNSG